MVKKSFHFDRCIVGPYGLFTDRSGRFIVAREVNASSDSGEVLSMLSSAPRFSTVREFGIARYVSDDDGFMAEVREYAIVEDIDFSYGDGYGGSSDGMHIACSMFGVFLGVFGGWRDFYNEVHRAGGVMLLEWDEDGIDYDRISSYVVRLILTGGVAERLIKSEGYRLW
jgi:hypothetical protein